MSRRKQPDDEELLQRAGGMDTEAFCWSWNERHNPNLSAERKAELDSNEAKIDQYLSSLPLCGDPWPESNRLKSRQARLELEAEGLLSVARRPFWFDTYKESLTP